MVLKWSTSSKIAVNRKQRTRLSIENFWQIHEAAPVWLQVALEMSLVTLQARRECVDMQYAHIVDGELHVVRKKTAGDSACAFIRIPVTDTIQQTIAKSRLDEILSPYIVHMRPASMRSQHLKNKEHWSAVTPDYLSKTFKRIRDQVGVGKELEPRQRPTFHEVRSLGGRTYIELGRPKQFVQALMTHSDEKVTDIYLAGGELETRHYRQVVADMALDQLSR